MANEPAAASGAPPLEPQLLWSFHPDGRKARRLAAEIDRRLIDSLRYVFDEIGEPLGLDRQATNRWLDFAERADRLHPMIHTLLHSLVAEVESGATARARALAERMLELEAAPSKLAIVPLGLDESDERPVQLASRFADLEEENRLDLIAPDPAAMGPVSRLIEEGLALVARNDPDLGEEFRALVSEIWLAQQAPGHRFTTAAVSCFQNWGGLIVNPDVHHVPLDAVELIAHEATHLLLFAIALDEPLLTNSAEERHHSPLREGPRSMDGVFHATIVGARIIRAMLRQAEAEGSESQLRLQAVARAAQWASMFDEGVTIIEANARLTPLGRRVLDESKDFVETHREGLATGEARPDIMLSGARA